MFQVCEFLLNLDHVAGDGFNVNKSDSLQAETGQCEARYPTYSSGHIDVSHMVANHLGISEKSGQKVDEVSKNSAKK